MKKVLLVIAMTAALGACAPQTETVQEDVSLRDAYSACINTSKNSPEKLQACQSVLDVLKKDKQHKEFAEKESVRVLDYQRCLQAAKTGNGQAYEKQCDKVWQEIRANNG
ncbi:hypothetical protein I2494_06310 [Budviciaceae bacterium BWR-B9]|uniref:Lipoprotein n=1 Tax=Limnobaculum allomyrinae TaxID=2791986 RepID=A0ABS1INJ3_9GAMM|nr:MULTISPECIES: ChiQ/YbfN family lipoprotein [Limnobaculum]MBK5143333.1 hypothetical protein [Limnobaculum allomyrinae]MBV7691221.1 hypothetical protein [Limnobaculum sp. M2-1]